MEKRSVKKNYFYNLLYQIVVILVPIVTTPYLSRVLEADGIGTYSFIFSIVTYFTLFGTLGVAMYGQREIAYVQDDKAKRSKAFYEIIFFRFITIIISIIAYLICFGRSGENSLYYRIFALELVANAFDISWFFQGIEDFKKTVLRNVFVKVLSVCLIFLLVKTKEDLFIYILIYVMSNVIGNLSLWLYLPKYLQKLKLKELNLKKHIKPILSMFIPQIAIQIYTVLDKTMIGVMLDDMSEVGFYEQSQKIVKVALVLVTAYGTVMCPRYANAASNGDYMAIKKYLNKSFTIACMVGIAITFGIIGISDNLVPWFLGEGYEKVKVLLKISAFLNIAIGLNNVSGVQYLVQIKKQNIFTISVIFGAIINFVLNIVFIYLFKSVGATIASIIAEFSILIYQLIYIKKNSDFKISSLLSISIKYLISGVIMLFILIAIGKILESNMISTLLMILVGSVVYFVSLLILKDKFLINTLSDLKVKLKREIFKENTDER